MLRDGLGPVWAPREASEWRCASHTSDRASREARSSARAAPAPRVPTQASLHLHSARSQNPPDIPEAAAEEGPQWLKGYGSLGAWLRPRPSPRSDNGGVRRPRRSAPGARGAHHLRRMLVGLRRGARRSETHNSAPRMQRGFAAAPAPRSHGAAITASPGTRLERLQGAASLAPEAGLLPLPPAATTMEPGSGVRLPRGLAGPRPRRCPAGAAQPAAICDPRAPRPALRARDGWRRPEARLPSARPARGPRAAGTRERPRPSPPRPRRRPARGPPQVMGCFPFL